VTTAAITAPTQAEQANTAARQLEAFFLRQLLAEARPAAGGLDGGFAGDTFKQMLDEALADKMANAGGLGLAQLFEKQLAGTPELAPTASLQHVAAAAPAYAGASPLGSAPATVTAPARPGALGPALAGSPQFAIPVAGRTASSYGERLDPIHHTRSVHPGCDLAAPTGTRVAAAAAGEVVHAGPAGTYGNLVRIRHADGFETRYAHLSRVDVKAGDRVELGQPIGAVGSTGHSTGPHLHFEIRKQGKALDPTPYLPLHPDPNRATP
jgi:murein DD-endopeptidase MepM/ murein hydrolase activator NlpD